MKTFMQSRQKIKMNHIDLAHWTIVLDWIPEIHWSTSNFTLWSALWNCNGINASLAYSYLLNKRKQLYWIHWHSRHWLTHIQCTPSLHSWRSFFKKTHIIEAKTGISTISSSEMLEWTHTHAFVQFLSIPPSLCSLFGQQRPVSTTISLLSSFIFCFLPPLLCNPIYE